METCQAITRLYFGDDLGRRSSLERSPSLGNGGESGEAATATTPTTVAAPHTPLYHVFGIEADIQWHPSLETAAMRHDPIADDSVLAAGSPSSPSSAATTGGQGSEDLFTLEVFLYTVAQAVQGWRTRSASPAFAATTAASTSAPLHVIVKLDFKAFKAAQQFLTHAETRSWAGLEALCATATSTRSRRRPSLRSFVSPRLESATNSTTTSAAAYTAASTAAATPQPVHVELWWNADVVAQPDARPHPLSVAAAPTAAVLQLMARTAQALGHRLPFGFSLGWVLCPRVVPPEVLALAPTTSITAPVYVTYREADDVPTMVAFLDGLAQALAGEKAASAAEPAFTAAPALTAANIPDACIHLFTFPMLFESVFADVYSEADRVAAFAAAAEQSSNGPRVPTGRRQKSIGAVETATGIAAARGAEESRRVASAVVAHAMQTFFPVHPEGGEGTSAAAATAAAAASKGVSAARCFPTFWKAVHPPPATAVSGGEDREWQAGVNEAARELFPYCTIDG